MLNCTFLIALYAVIENDRYKLVLEQRIFGKVLIVHMDLSCLKSYRNGNRIIIPVSYIYIIFLGYLQQVLILMDLSSYKVSCSLEWMGIRDNFLSNQF